MELLRNEPPNSIPSLGTIAIAHGAGAGKHHPFLERVAVGLASRGLVVVRFDFPYMAERRGRPDPTPVLLQCWREVVAELGGGEGLMLAGKSLGGRMASMVADEVGARGLVCLGYPFHAPGREPTATRLDHLATLQTPTLIVQGTRDPFGTVDEVGGYRLSNTIKLLWLEDGDHSLTPRKRSGFTVDGHLVTALDAIADFAGALPPQADA